MKPSRVSHKPARRRSTASPPTRVYISFGERTTQTRNPATISPQSTGKSAAVYNPCPCCGTERSALEAPCAECDFSPAPPRGGPQCQNCGVEADTRSVAFHQIVGLSVVWIWSSVEGNYCKACVHRAFWQTTLVNVLLGWWGFPSLLVTPCFLLHNLVGYVSCLILQRGQDVAEEEVWRLSKHDIVCQNYRA